jgi:hypothetical protein
MEKRAGPGVGAPPAFSMFYIHIKKIAYLTSRTEMPIGFCVHLTSLGVPDAPRMLPAHLYTAK